MKKVIAVIVCLVGIVTYSGVSDAAVPPCEEACETGAWSCDYECTGGGTYTEPYDPMVTQCINGCVFSWYACLSACE